MDPSQYYDVFSKTYEDRRHEGYHRFLDEAELSIVMPHARDRAVLEVGCGTGLILRRLADVAHRATGIDLSEGMLEVARARGLDVHQGDACELPFEDSSFDVTCSFKVLAHVPDRARALSEMARVTRPGGVIIAEYYNRASWRTLVKRLKPATHIGQGGAVDDEQVYTRYDLRSDVAGDLPSGVTIERVDGIRILSPVALPFNVPVLGTAWASLEKAAMRTPLRHFGGFMVLTLRCS